MIRYEGARGVVWRVKYTDAEGRQVQETVGAERDGVTRKHAAAELRERLVRVERKGYKRPKPLTFEQYADAWHESGIRSQGWKPRTIVVYRNAIDHYLAPWFGKTRLDGIRPRDVSAFIDDAMTRSQGKHKKPLSGKYVNQLLNITYSIFKAAIGEELVDSNPVWIGAWSRTRTSDRTPLIGRVQGGGHLMMLCAAQRGRSLQGRSRRTALAARPQSRPSKS